MKIIVDTNIIFSALLNSNNVIGDILFNSDEVFQFYSCSYMRLEIEKHWVKLKRISKLSDNALGTTLQGVLSKVTFINEELIPEKTWLWAEQIVDDIDKDDVDFVAVTKHLKGNLWTGDKDLYRGLKEKKFKKVFVTSELSNLRSRRSN